MSGWETILTEGLVPKSSEPIGSFEGQTYYNTSDNTSYIFDGTSWQVIGGSGELLVTQTVYVDGTIGDDGTGVSGDMSKPFKTIAGANAVAIANDVVHIRPSIYDESDIVKDGVVYYFDKGAIVHPTDATQIASGKSIIHTVGYSNRVVVLGNGEFISDYTGTSIGIACIYINNSDAYLHYYKANWTESHATGGVKGAVYLNSANLIEMYGAIEKSNTIVSGNASQCIYINGGYDYIINGVFTNSSTMTGATGIYINGTTTQNISITGKIYVEATTSLCYGIRSTNNYMLFSWTGDIEIGNQANGYSIYADSNYSGECRAIGTFLGAIHIGMGGLEGRGMYMSGLQVCSATPSGYALQLVDDAYCIIDLVISSSQPVFNVTAGAILFQGCATIHSDNKKFLTQTGGKFIFSGLMNDISRRLTNSSITGGECVIQSDFEHWGSNYPSDEYLFYLDGGTLRIEGCKVENHQSTNGSGVIEYVSGNLILNGATLVSENTDVSTFSIKVISALNYIAYNDSYANMPVGGGGSLTNSITGGGTIVVDSNVE